MDTKGPGISRAVFHKLMSLGRKGAHARRVRVKDALGISTFYKIDCDNGYDVLRLIPISGTGDIVESVVGRESDPYIQKSPLYRAAVEAAKELAEGFGMKTETQAVQTEVQAEIREQLEYEAFEDQVTRDSWRVEAIDFDSEGECYVAIFSGPGAEGRAREYASWKNSHVEGSKRGVMRDRDRDDIAEAD